MSTSPRPRPRRRRQGPTTGGWVLIGSAVVAVIAIAVGIYFLVGGSPAEKPTETVKPSAASTSTAGDASSTPAASGSTTRSDDGSVKSAEQVVIDFYAALNANDAAKVAAQLSPEAANSFDAEIVAAWEPNTFTLVRGTIENGVAMVFGKEKVEAYGAAAPGGVKFTLARSGDAWQITDMQPVDSGLLSGAPPAAAAAGGLAGPLSDKTARDIVTKLLAARQKGDGKVIRSLTTAKFQADNGSAWLEGIDNSEYFTKFSVTSVKLAGKSATVVTSETWPEGTVPSTYGLVETGGKVFVDTWAP
jgi:hypothetical protein